MADESREAAFRSALGAALLAEPGLIAFGPDIAEKHHADWTGLPPVRPMALALPQTTDQVSAILAAACVVGVPVVPQGGLTGLVGGAHPVENCLALSLERLSGVEEVDPLSGVMVVRAGTPLQAVQAAAEDAGLSFPLDLGSRGSCSIGGNIATNAGGNRVIRYGPTREHVLGLEVVLPDGTIVNGLNRLVKNNTGYDLKQLFIGSEGTLGVITRAVLKLQPRPLGVSVALCAVPDFDALLGLLAALKARLGPGLTAFEAMWPDFWELMTNGLPFRSPFQQAHGAYALIELSGFEPGRDAERLDAVLAELLETGALADAVVAQSGREAEAFWRIRDGVAEFRALLGPIVSFDFGIEARRTGAFVEASAARLRARFPDAVHLAFGHLGDNNVHIVAAVPSAGADQPKHEIEEAIYGALPEFGGSVSAEHGIGLTKKRFLALSRNDEERALMRLVKGAIDPRGLMNPGKLFDEI